jgi:hypothetical protein
LIIPLFPFSISAATALRETAFVLQAHLKGVFPPISWRDHIAWPGFREGEQS